jgi:esterase/lipase
MPVWQAATMSAATQMNKAIPLLLDMNGKMSQMLEKQDKTTEEIKGLREDIQPGFAVQFRQLQADMKAVKDRLGMS